MRNFDFKVIAPLLVTVVLTASLFLLSMLDHVVANAQGKILLYVLYVVYFSVLSWCYYPYVAKFGGHRASKYIIFAAIGGVVILLNFQENSDFLASIFPESSYLAVSNDLRLKGIDISGIKYDGWISFCTIFTYSLLFGILSRVFFRIRRNSST